MFFQNEDDSALFAERCLVRPEQIRLLSGSGIDIRRFIPAPMPDNQSSITFLLIARMLRDKGVVEFAEAARALRAIYPETGFRLVGPLGVENRTAIEPQTLQGWVAEGIVEYVGAVDDVNGYLCRVRDADDLARAMQRMIESGPDAGREMGLAGRRRVESRFDETVVIERYRDELARLQRAEAPA